ncbi:MAG: hypothetical protein AUJ82_07230 [Verrucomicrobia bacterium CG1_02_43_26]|nr:MAG: hypothetical protein AUJ82_07230 [Verrucomicrobia bacterium CG1_02_43_26]
MAKKNIFLLKPWFVLGIFILIWATLPYFVKTFTRKAFYEFQAPFWQVNSHASDLQSFWAMRSHTKNELIEVCRDLARLNSAYELKLQENASLKHEIMRLEHSLELPPLVDFRYEIARVCRRDVSLWWQQIVIRKGKRDGIFPGAAVVYSGGVVGKVKEVFNSTSTVELVSSPKFRVATHFEGDDRPVTYQGEINTSFSNPIGSIQNVPEDIVVSVDSPKKLVSSRLGGVFPDGLFVGWVDSLERGFDGMFMRGNVTLENNLLKLDEVAVLIPMDKELIDEVRL